jgi:TPR repeat protein
MISEESTPYASPLWDRVAQEFEAKNFAEGLRILHQLAYQGNWYAYGVIGNLLQSGAQGVPADPEAAAVWYRRGIFEGDDPLAHLGLGRLYLSGKFGGKDGKKDFQSARVHFEKAYRGEVVQAGLFLGLFYQHGMGVERDFSVAKQYLDEANQHGYVAAKFMLAQIALREGKFWRGVKLIIASRIRWFILKISDPTDSRLLLTKGFGEAVTRVQGFSPKRPRPTLVASNRPTRDS